MAITLESVKKRRDEIKNNSTSGNSNRITLDTVREIQRQNREKERQNSVGKVTENDAIRQKAVSSWVNKYNTAIQNPKGLEIGQIDTLIKELDSIKGYASTYGLTGALQLEKQLQEVRNTLQQQERRKLETDLLHPERQLQQDKAEGSTLTALPSLSAVDEATKGHRKQIQTETVRQQKYGGKSYGQIKEILAGMEDGEEKTWLENFAPSVMKTEDYDSELATVTQELEQLEIQYRQLVNVGGADYFDKGELKDAAQLQSRIRELSQRRDKLEDERKYGFLSESSDYKKFSAYRSDDDNKDIEYHIINGRSNKFLDRAKSQVGSLPEKASRMTPEEISNYNYLYHSEGKDAAGAYLQYLEPMLNGRRMEETVADAKAFAREYPTLADLASVGGTLAGGVGVIDALGQKIAKDVQGDYYEPVDYNTPAFAPSIAGSTIRGTRAGMLAEKHGTIALDEGKHPVLSKIFNGKSWGDVYQLGMSMIDSAAVALMSPVIGTAGTLMLSGSAATQTMLDAVENGATDEQALTMGALSGAFEYLFEKYELESLLKNGSESMIRAFVAQSLSEGFGEGATTIANTVADTIVMADKSDVSRMVAEYMQKNPNMTEEEARKKAWMDIAIQTGWDVVGGVASGSIMGGGYSAINLGTSKLQQLAQDKVNAEQDALHKLANEMHGVEEMENTAHVDGVKYSIKRTQNMSWDEQITGALSQGKSILRNDTLVLDDVPAALVNDGIESKKLAIPLSVITKAKSGKDASHSIQDANLKDLQRGVRNAPIVINNPARNALVFVTDIRQDGAPVLVAFQKNTQFDGDDVHKATSIHLQMNVASMLKALPSNATVYAKNESELDAAVGVADSLRSLAASVKFTGNTVTENVAGVNGENSSSEGRVLRGGDPVQIADVESAGGGKLTVRLTDGSTADISELSFPNVGEQELWRVLAEYSDHAEAARQLLKEYSAGDLQAFEYAKGVEEGFLYGKLNISDAEMSRRGSYVNLLNPMQKNMAYKYGQYAGEKQAKRRQANIDAVYKQAQSVLQQKGKTQKETYRAVAVDGIRVEDMKPSQKEAFHLAEMIAPGIQANIEVYNGGKEWGYYNPRTDTICLNINANWNKVSMLAFTLGHELAHRAKRGSPVQFKAFADFLVQKYCEQGSSVKDMIAEQLKAAEEHDKSIPKDKRLNMTEEQAFEEVVADACQKMLLDTNAGQRLAEFGAQSEQNRDFLHKFAKKLREILEKLRDIFKNVQPDSLAAKEFARFDANTKQILADMFVDMGIDAGEKLSTIKAAGMTEKITTKDGGVKHKKATLYDYSKSFEEQIDDFKKGTFPALDTFVVCGTPTIYQKIGFNALPMTINRTHIDYALNGTKNAEHSIGERLLKQLPNALNKPIAVIVSRSAPSTSVVVLVSLKHNGEQVIAPIYLDGAGRQNGISIDSNAITSVHGRSNAITGLLNNALKEESKGNVGVFYWDKKTATALMTTSGVTMPQRLSLHDGYIHSIRESGSPVNMKFKDVTETQQFKRWFGDWMMHPDKASKVVNADGTPMVVYHGSADQFNTFSYGHIGSASGVSILGEGFYFSDKKKLAKGYGGNVYECYLQMKKPYYATESDAYKLNTKKLEAQGYDGVILKSPSGNVFMVFQNTQIKSATDNIGTFDGGNPDIRYKLPVSKDVSDRELLVEMFAQTVTDSKEYKALEYYRKHIQEMQEIEEKLERISAEIRRLSFAEGPRDTETLNRLKLQQKQAVNRLNNYDNILLRLEKSGVLRAMIERSRKQITQESFNRAREYYRERNERRETEIREYYRESRRKAVERHDLAQVRQQIRKDVAQLDSLLNKGTKNKNVKLGLQDFVGAALRTAKGVFLNDYNEYDMIRNGLQNKLLPEEQAAFDRCRELLKELDKLRDEQSAQPGADNLHDKWDPEAALRREDREEALKRELYQNMRILRDGNVFQRERAGTEQATAEELLNELLSAYKALENSELEHIRGVYNEALYKQIEKVKNFLSGKAIKDMTSVELKELQKMYRMVSHTVSHANELFGKRWTENVRQRGEKAIQQLRTAVSKDLPAFLEKIRSYGWSILSLDTVMEIIGSDVLTEHVQELYDAEDTYQRDLEHARKFAEDQAKKYGRKDWRLDKQVEFAGTTITIGQAMSLYAYSRRKQGQGHLEGDGFTHSKNVRIKKSFSGKMPVQLGYIKNATRNYKVTREMYGELEKLLTKQQREYVKEMQEYLSKVMGAKGNEVSEQLHGIPLFEETVYFPLKTAKEFSDTALGATTGERKMKNTGFTETVKKGADKAIVLDDFERVWSEHVNQMSNYHAYVLPMENFNRVYNYRHAVEQEVRDAAGEVYKTELVDTNESVKLDIENRVGSAANAYIVKYMQNLNGGTRSDATEALANGILGNFRKTRVLGSGSVIVQQPSAFLRAMAKLDVQDLVDWKQWRKKYSKPPEGLRKEMYRYCPVAGIKKMGGFDPSVGRTARQYLFGEYHDGENPAQRVTGWVNEKLGMLPEAMDEVTWTYIWYCSKQQIRRTNPGLRVGSQEFCQEAAKLFSQIVRETQVYDSITVKPLMMQSKNTYLKTLTAFMNEPLKGLNQTIRAWARVKHGKTKARQAVRETAAVFAADLAAGALSAFFYAFRDDDDDETYWEKYLSALTGKVWESLIPLYKLPYIKDVLSLAEGYESTRSDTALVNELLTGLENIFKPSTATTPQEKEKEVWDRLEKGYGYLLNFVGIPGSNLIREIRGIYRTAKKTLENSWVDATAAGTKYALLEGLPFGEETSKQKQLENAVAEDDTAHLQRVLGTWDNQDTALSNLRTAIKEVWLAGKITDDRAMEYLQELAGHDAEEAQDYITKWEFKKAHPGTELTDAKIIQYADVAEPAGISLEIYTQYVEQTKDLSSDEDGQSKQEKVWAVIHRLPLSRKQKNALHYASGYKESSLDEAPWN